MFHEFRNCSQILKNVGNSKKVCKFKNHSRIQKMFVNSQSLWIKKNHANKKSLVPIFHIRNFLNKVKKIEICENFLKFWTIFDIFFLLKNLNIVCKFQMILKNEQILKFSTLFANLWIFKLILNNCFNNPNHFLNLWTLFKIVNNFENVKHFLENKNIFWNSAHFLKPQNFFKTDQFINFKQLFWLFWILIKKNREKIKKEKKTENPKKREKNRFRNLLEGKVPKTGWETVAGTSPATTRVIQWAGPSGR